MAPKKRGSAAQETESGPHGFREVAEKKEVFAPVIDREYFAGAGIIARYLGTRRVKRENDGRFRSEFSKLHNFQLPKSHGGTQFAMWGTARLDRRIDAVKVGAILHVQYRGVHEVEGFDNPVHDWLVSVTTGVPSQETLDDFADRHAEVTKAVRAADEEFKRTRNVGAVGVDTDDDLPF